LLVLGRVFTSGVESSYAPYPGADDDVAAPYGAP